MPEDVASNEGLGHVHVAGVKAMGHFSGPELREARSGRTEGKPLAPAPGRRASRLERCGAGAGRRCVRADGYVSAERAREYGLEQWSPACARET